MLRLRRLVQRNGSKALKRLGEMTDRRKDPSGRPIRDRYLKASPYRSAPVEPLTLGLRRREISTHAIGFTVDLLSDYSNDLVDRRRL